jgi:hypothetical protein
MPAFVMKSILKLYSLYKTKMKVRMINDFHYIFLKFKIVKDFTK